MMMANYSPTEWVQFIGHFHPVLVHLPIGFLILLAVLELTGSLKRFRGVRHARPLILVLTALTAAASAACGWLLSESGDYDRDLLAWHKWMGVALAAAVLATTLVYWLASARIYYSGLLVCLALLTLASHIGATITHGRGYLTEHWPWRAPGNGQLTTDISSSTTQPSAVGTSPDWHDQPAFAKVIQPIFAQNCASCHGPEKSKAQLRLDSPESIARGGKSGREIIPGNSTGSRMVQFLLLPRDDKHHMPPEGKSQPSQQQLALIRWWIDSGASFDKKIADLPRPPAIERLLASSLGKAASQLATASTTRPTVAIPPRPLALITPLCDSLGAELGIVIVSTAPGEPWLDCSAATSRSFGDAQLAKLQPLCVNIKSLNLAGTQITDAGLATVARMPNLTHLYLENTAITDAGLDCVCQLPNLEYLNLYGTAITDRGLAKLRSLPRLHQIYLWRTRVTPDAAKEFADNAVDKLSISQWQKQIEELQARIREQQIVVNYGSAMLPQTRPTTRPTTRPK